MMLPLVFLTACLASPFDVDSLRLGRAEAVLDESVRRGDCPGGVLLVLNEDRVVYRHAFGDRQKTPEAIPMTPDTIFDMASLTKSVTTATSIMILIESGQLRLSDPVAKHWPEFAANGKETVTVEQCLLHTTGLTADNSIKDYVGTRKEMLDRIAALKLEAPAGTRFRYSDVGFIVLGHLVELISEKPLDEFAREKIFVPLKMNDTGFRIAGKTERPIAPSGNRNGKMIVGAVHDPRAFALGGVAGHAGLFSTADDLARYCRMLLRGGELDGVRILSPLTVKLFTEPVDVPRGGQRSRGWDVDTSFTAQRGDLFERGTGFGHTGFTGTSIWFDPPSQTAIILLTNRLHPNDKGNVTPLRRKIGTLVASALTNQPAAKPTGKTRPKEAEAPTPRSPVLSGIDVLVQEKFASLKGRRIGLVTNHTGKSLDGTPTIDLFHKAPDLKLVALFSPEHGIRGELDAKVGDTTDEQTGLPVYSLYGQRTKPTPEQIVDIDTLVYDIQDIGCRFYTYSSTLGLLLETAAEHGKKVVVLDRPNPIDGITVEGPIRDPNRSSFVAYHEMPLRHGLTVGEMARLFAKERNLKIEPEIIRVRGWQRNQTFDHTGQPWRNPSPNMRHLTAALIYPGVGLLETTNVSVGRGTERPFEWIGAPWIDGVKLAAALNARGIPGVRFLPVSRKPVSSTHRDQECGGVDILVTNWETVEPVRLGLTLASTIRELFSDGWNPKNYDRLLVHKATYEALLAGKSVAEIEASWLADLDQFRVRRQAVLLYPE